MEPLHDEAIERSFAIATKEVTLRQYGLFKPDRLRGIGVPLDLELPVGNVTLQDAMAYCRWLTQQEKDGGGEKAMCYAIEKDGSLQVRSDWLTRTGYRLPTEAEWECACRAGTATLRYYGHSDEYLSSYAWCLVNSAGTTHEVGLLLPNDLGLFDMYGNVAEWCQNRFTGAPAAAADVLFNDSYRILRGGDGVTSLAGLRSPSRMGTDGKYQSPFIGFRIARTHYNNSNTMKGKP
jgi:formylglycine-generating enzyme required for sulfatase activity